MSASFTSALPRQVPSSQRGGHQFRQRSHNLTPSVSVPLEPSSTSVYSQFQANSIDVTGLETITLVKRSMSRQTSSYFSGEIDLAQRSGSFPPAFPSSYLQESNPFSLQTAPDASESVGSSKTSDNSLEDGFSPSNPTPSLPSESIGAKLQCFLLPFFTRKESNPTQVPSDTGVQPGMTNVMIDGYSRSNSINYSRLPPVKSSSSMSSIRLVEPLLGHGAATVSCASFMTDAPHPSHSDMVLLPTPNLHSLVGFASAGATTAILASPRMLSSIGRTTINFTRKFPTRWKTSTASDGLGFVPLVDGEDDFFGIEDGKSLYLSARTRRNHEGLGLDGDSLGIGRWTSYKWVLSFSVLSVSAISISERTAGKIQLRGALVSNRSLVWALVACS
jgi:hypothetical protein